MKHRFTSLPKKGMGTVAFMASLLFLICYPLLTAAAKTRAPVIDSAVPNYTFIPPRLTIQGSHFGTTQPVITIADISATVVSYNNTTVVVVIPPLILATPGSYTLSLTRGSDRCVTETTFDITLGAVGPPGPTGAPGTPGAPGAPGAAGTVLDFAEFYALMPGDNTATVATGAPVLFPTPGLAKTATSITPSVSSPTSEFLLGAKGIYQVMFQVSVTEAGQLDLAVNGIELPYTVVGRATGTSQIVGMALVKTSDAVSYISVFNPAANSTALTITTHAGGAAASAVSAHLIITLLEVLP